MIQCPLLYPKEPQSFLLGELSYIGRQAKTGTHFIDVALLKEQKDLNVAFLKKASFLNIALMKKTASAG